MKLPELKFIVEENMVGLVGKERVKARKILMIGAHQDDNEFEGGGLEAS